MSSSFMWYCVLCSAVQGGSNFEVYDENPGV